MSRIVVEVYPVTPGDIPLQDLRKKYPFVDFYELNDSSYTPPYILIRNDQLDTDFFDETILYQGELTENQGIDEILRPFLNFREKANSNIFFFIGGAFLLLIAIILIAANVK